MEMRQLRYFTLVAQELSFARASKQAYLSQQALSKAIISLENELGVQLFSRSPHGVDLTYHGQLLLKRANRILSEISSIENDFRNPETDANQIIRLAVTSGIENSIPVQDFLRFSELYPQYSISTTVCDDKTIESWLHSDKIEMAITGAQGNSLKLDFIHLFDDNSALIVHKDNPLSRKASIKLQDLKNETFLGCSTEYYAVNRLFLLCNFLDFIPKTSHITQNILYIEKLLSHNQGVFLCPDCTSQYFSNPDIRVLPFEDDPNIFSVNLVFKKDRPLSKGVNLLREFIINLLKS